MAKAPPRSVATRPDGTVIVRVGIAPNRVGDLYHLLLTTSWPRLLTLVVAFILVVNALFGTLFSIDPEGIAQSDGSWLDAFFFSVQTFATIGYGAMAPKSLFAHILVTIESIVGVISIAILAGVMFTRFSRPTARILFSKVAVVAKRNGVPSLMFRMANERSNLIVEANFRATVLLEEKTAEGETLRRLHDLTLLRSSTPTFTLTFTAVHPIDEKSPLRGLDDPQKLAASNAQIFVSLVGIDETFAQTVHARTAYEPATVLFGSRFVDILQTMRDGGNLVDYTRFHEVIADT